MDRPQGSSQNSLTVVFDGKEEFFGSQAQGSVKVIFSQGQSADDLIKKIVEQSAIKKTWVIVSDDKEIRFYVRALGANVLTVREFTRTLSGKSKQSRQRPSQGEPGKYISLTQEARINQELERLWIKKKP